MEPGPPYQYFLLVISVGEVVLNVFSLRSLLLFIGVGGQNNTLVSACCRVCLHTRTLLNHDCK